MNKITAPGSGEYHPFYGGYISKIQNRNPWRLLNEAHREVPKFLVNIPDEKWMYAYDKGKWTIKEVVQHMIDAERIFAYRLLRISRGDKTPLAGFDENEYIPASTANSREVSSLINEYSAVRMSTITLVESIHESSFTNMGTASKSEVSVRALVYMIIGHEMHHLEVLRERYLAGPEN